MSKQLQDFEISIPILQDYRVDFLSEIRIPVQIRSRSRHTIVIENIALRFQSDYKANTSNVTKVQPCHGYSVEPMHFGYQYVNVTPNLLYRAHTNYFDVIISYHRRLNGRLSRKMIQDKSDVSYLIVNPVPPMYGDIFISYKQPEDLPLAEQFFKLAQHAGFSPYIAPKDIRPGTEIWDKKIPQAIERSKCIFVIWTSNTHTGNGVQREIEISRSAKVQDILLLQKGVRTPEQYRGSDKEYVRFEPANAILEFAKTLQAHREAC